MAVTSSIVADCILHHSEAHDPGRVGGKAAALAKMADIAAIPPWFVLLPEAFGVEGMAEAVVVALGAVLARLGPGPYAVRSSAVGEDGVSAAHAGQFLTELGVHPHEVAAAAWRVWRSGSAANVAAYRAAHQIANEAIAVAVIVQQQLAPSAAGIAFTADPVSGRRDRLIISATAGLADRLAAGEEDGETYCIDRVSRESVSATGAGVAVLSMEDRARVAALAEACERQAGCPQDVEWAIEGSQLYLLQSRPITTLPALHDSEVLTIWDNSNIVESYPGLVSPLTFSFARFVYAHVYRVLLRTLGVSDSVIGAHRPVLENLLGRIDGHVYYHLLNWYRVLALLPGFAVNRRFMEQMMGVGEALPDAVAAELAPPRPHGLALVRAWRDIVAVGGGLAWRALTLPRMIRRFERRLGEVLDTKQDLAPLSLSALAASYRALESGLLERWDAPLVNDLICMIAFGLSRRVLEREAGPAGLALHNDVMIGQGTIISAEPAQRIRALGAQARFRPDLIAALQRGDARLLADGSEFSAGLRAYLDRFGDRCPEELKLESVPLTDDPLPLLRGIAAAAGAQTEPRQAEPRPELARLVPRRHRRWIVVALLRWAKARVRDRENLRFQRTRVFGQVRRLVRGMGSGFAAAQVLDQPDDVFFLTIDEVLGAIEGGAVSYDLRGLVTLRRQEYEQDRAKPEPPERIEMRGAIVLGRRGSAAVAAAPDDAMFRTGTGCAPGSARGPAKVVRDPRAESVAPGDILVARHTDPGWIALFANIAGIVVERGSLLSHSAIVAREMGIPCVVGVKGAVGWIETGVVIEIDGSLGVVRKCR